MQVPFDSLTHQQARLTEQARIKQESARLSTLSNEELARERNNVCPYCHRLLVPRAETYTVFGVERPIRIWPDRCGCAGEQAAIESRREIERQTAADRSRLEHATALQRAGLTEHLSRYQFDTFDVRADWPDARAVLTRVKTYAYALANGTLARKPWLILCGDYGLGKSHLAGAVVRSVIDAGWRDCYFRVWPSYLRRLQQSWYHTKRGEAIPGDEFGAETEADIINELIRGRVVVIDDLDKREGSPWVRSALYDVLNSRYNADAPTILTFNTLSGDQLLDFIGESVLDRILEQAYDVIEFHGPSYRRIVG